MIRHNVAVNPSLNLSTHSSTSSVVSSIARPLLAMILIPLALMGVMFYSYHQSANEAVIPNQARYMPDPSYVTQFSHRLIQSVDEPASNPAKSAAPESKQSSLYDPHPNNHMADPPPPSPLATYPPYASTLTWGLHHGRFTNVCFREGFYNETLRNYIPGRTLMYGVSWMNQLKHQGYFHGKSPNWGVKNEYIENHTFPPINPTTNRPVQVMTGKTFFYSLFNDNIAQFYQELMCQIPPLMNRQYRLSINDTKSNDQSINPSLKPWNHFFAPHIQFENGDNRSLNFGWCAAQLKWIINALQETQLDARIHIWDEIFKRDMLILNQKNVVTPIACFEDLTLYQPGSCHGLVGPYPPGTNETYAIIKRSIFKQLNLEPSRPCASKMMIYDRYNALRRRIMNAAQVKTFFETKLRGVGKGHVNVSHLQDLPKNVFDQAKLFNDFDIIIQPHSASNYNALFMHDGAFHAELGEHGSWFGEGMAPYIDTGLIYKKYQFGWELISWDKNFDNQEYSGERSFHVKQELMDAMWDDMKDRFCVHAR